MLVEKGDVCAAAIFITACHRMTRLAGQKMERLAASGCFFRTMDQNPVYAPDICEDTVSHDVHTSGWECDPCV